MAARRLASDDDRRAVDELIRLVGAVLCLTRLEGRLLGLQGVLGRVQLVHLGRDVAHGQAGVLAGRLGAGGAPGEQGGVAARRVRPRVDVGLDGLALDDVQVLGEVALVCGQLLVQLGDGLRVTGHPGRGHRGLLAGGVDLELFEHQALGHGGRLGPEVADGIGAGGPERRPEGQACGDHEQGEAQGPERSTGPPRCVWPRQRGRSGAKHETTNLPAGRGGGQAAPDPLVRGVWAN